MSATTVSSPPKIAYVSVDTENDGPDPCTGNMVELGVCAIDAATGVELMSFSSPIQRRMGFDGGATELQCLREFGRYEELITRSDSNPTVKVVMFKLAFALELLRDQGYRFVWVARPAAYDWMWLWCYWSCYGPEPQGLRSLVPFKCQCISTLFSLWVSTRGITDDKAEWKRLAGDHPHTHHALDDAREQCAVYLALMQRFAGALTD
jgi:hypothetical protein